MDVFVPNTTFAGSAALRKIVKLAALVIKKVQHIGQRLSGYETAGIS